MSAYGQHYYHHSYYPYHYSDYNRDQNYQPNDREFFRRQPHTPSYYSAHTSYQTSFFAHPGFLSTNFNQYGIPGSALAPSYRYDNRYRAQHTWPYLHQRNHHQWGAQDSAFPLTNYSRPYPSGYNSGPVYQFEREVRYFPYPVYINQGVSSFSSGRSRRYPALSRFPYTPSNISNYANLNPLPPKIRVIFIPPSISLPQQQQQQQQQCNLTPCIPPFLFNRISQPQCSLPLPPPLPQLSSLPLPPAVQQMVMQQYSNPVAILPFAANYFTPSAVPQQPPSIMPAPALPTPQCAVQPSAVPVLPPTNIPMALSNPPAPYAYANPNVFASQPTSGDYPSTCRACVPAPPPLTVPVTGHCWVQHCSACHHVPTDVSNPNERPHNHGRMTPLLRQPTVEQYIYDERNQQQQSPQQHYPHINPQARLNSWSNNLPPLPPGAVIISDEYITKDGLAQTQDHTRTCRTEQSGAAKSLRWSGESSIYNTNNTVVGNPHTQNFTHRQSSSSETSNKARSKLKTSPLHSYVSKSRQSVGSSIVSAPKQSINSTDLHVTNYASEKERSLARRHLSAMSRMINLRYQHQVPDIQAIYHSNDQEKSSDEDSRSITNSIIRSSSNHEKRANLDNQSQTASFASQHNDDDNKSIQSQPLDSSKSEQFKSLAEQTLMTASTNSLNTTSMNTTEGHGISSPTPTTQTDIEPVFPQTV
ncbi:unnamed protein product [Adineta ricciae]|uniref:Uncharacterized protein n=1 Tax=Adineta ricciae TaxID=249248 RepID=A0A814YS93_ADIRI|nr:unnamed protein product [Adineta ricciae]